MRCMKVAIKLPACLSCLSGLLLLLYFSSSRPSREASMLSHIWNGYAPPVRLLFSSCTALSNSHRWCFTCMICVSRPHRLRCRLWGRLSQSRAAIVVVVVVGCGRSREQLVSCDLYHLSHLSHRGQPHLTKQPVHCPGENPPTSSRLLGWRPMEHYGMQYSVQSHLRGWSQVCTVVSIKSRDMVSMWMIAGETTKD